MHLQQYALELGLSKPSGMGAVPIDWQDIQAWSCLTGTYLHPEEARILKSLSQTYVLWSQKAKQYDCNAPYFEDETPVDRSATIKQQVAMYKRKRGK